ncbi:MAG: adenylyltransferase/cytidyltransferase family protein [Patescibacteria group bacterium]|nr:adenylyltransferase/cytidyltransferase family protein [Patescibacteria group bacterium]
MVFGTFDSIHPGHEFLLAEARKHGDWLVVVIARDQTVKRIKGRFPVHSESVRKQKMETTGLADQVVLGSKSSPYTIFNTIKPEVICLGYDQEMFIDELPRALEQRGLKAEIIRLNPYKPEQYKSSLLNK